MTYKRIGEPKLAKIAEKFLEKTVDIVLIGIYLNLEFPKYARNQRWKIEGKIQEDFEEVNYQTIKRAIDHLRKQGLVQAIKKADALPKITQSGEKKIVSLLPFYDEKRTWDGKLYLITYDLPIKKNNDRNFLRKFLKSIGCGMLQKSVWITPYNPTTLLENFAKKRSGLNDLILVSSLGKGGTIGSMEISDLIEMVYHLNEINSRYRELIEKFRGNELVKDHFIFAFLSILKDDPQLPFDLLPETWLGEKAYKLFKSVSKQP